MTMSPCPQCGAPLLRLSALKPTQQADRRGRRWYQFTPELAECRACGARLVPHPIVIRAMAAVFLYWLAYVFGKHALYAALDVASRSGRAWTDGLFLGAAVVALVVVIIRHGYVLAGPAQD